MGDPGKYNTGGIPRGPPTIEDDLDNNGPTARGRWRVQRYRVGGGDMEGAYLHHEQPPDIRHPTPRCYTWFQTRVSDRDSYLGVKVGVTACGDISQSPFTGVI